MEVLCFFSPAVQPWPYLYMDIIYVYYYYFFLVTWEQREKLETQFSSFRKNNHL